MDTSDITRIKTTEKEVILVGTAHVSQESVNLVSTTIASEKPTTVCVELCKTRYETIKQQDKWQQTDILQVIREKKSSLLLSQLAMAAFQKRIAKKLNIVPGAEMLKAIEIAEAQGIRLELVDRDIRITMLRVWRTLGFWGKARFLGQVFASLFSDIEITTEEIEKLKKKDVLQMAMEEISAKYPSLKKTLIDERDAFLSCQIAAAPGERILAVLGAGHIAGVKANWGKKIDIDELNSIPPASIFAKYSGWTLLLVLLAIFVGGFFYGGTQTGLAMLGWWTLVTAICGASGAILMLAHPFTVLAAALSAPVATIHPLLATGWVAGIVEAMLRKPQVKDFFHLKEDIASLRGFLKNKVTRLLILVAVVNITASLGTFTALFIVTRLMLKG